MNKDIYSILNSTENQDAENERLSDMEANYIMKRFNERKTIKKSGGNKMKMTLCTAAAAAVAVILIPTSAYAYSRYKAEVSKTANYQNTITIENSVDSEAYSQLMKYEFGWLPEYLIPDKGGFKYHNADQSEGLTPVFYKLSKGKDAKIDMPFSDTCETYESKGKTAMINYRISYNNGESLNFGREIWVTFDDTDYLLEMYVTDGISQEDTRKIIDNIKLVPTDEVCFSLFDSDSRNETIEYDPPKEQVVDMEKLDIYGVDETISYDEPQELFGGYSVTLNSSEITDSFDGIHTDGCGWEYDFSEFMDENGNIAENTRSWVRLGDGVNTLNEVIKEEKIPMHILKLNLTYTNNLDEENEIIICPSLMKFEDGVPTVCWDYDEENQLSICDSIHMNDFGSHFSFDSEKKYNKNYVLLEPGESTEVELAFFVADDDVDKIYAYFHMSGNSLSRALQNGNCPIFDLRH